MQSELGSLFESCQFGDAREAQSVERPTLGVGSGRDFGAVG